MKKVKVDLQCPFCGLCKILKTAPHRKGIMCPACHQVIFLRWATGVEGMLIGMAIISTLTNLLP